jgi:DNA-binding NarL/FixJ family response regulator
VLNVSILERTRSGAGNSDGTTTIAMVMLSSNADKFVEEARKVGVQVYVARLKAGEALVEAVEAAVQGKILCFWSSTHQCRSSGLLIHL